MHCELAVISTILCDALEWRSRQIICAPSNTNVETLKIQGFCPTATEKKSSGFSHEERSIGFRWGRSSQHCKTTSHKVLFPFSVVSAWSVSDGVICPSMRGLWPNPLMPQGQALIYTGRLEPDLSKCNHVNMIFHCITFSMNQVKRH